MRKTMVWPSCPLQHQIFGSAVIRIFTSRNNPEGSEFTNPQQTTNKHHLNHGILSRRRWRTHHSSFICNASEHKMQHGSLLFVGLGYQLARRKQCNWSTTVVCLSLEAITTGADSVDQTQPGWVSENKQQLYFTGMENTKSFFLKKKWNENSRVRILPISNNDNNKISCFHWLCSSCNLWYCVVCSNLTQKPYPLPALVCSRWLLFYPLSSIDFS